MDFWIYLTLAAALFQTLRFMLQKQLATSGLSPTGATFARFVFSAPVIAVAVVVYLRASGQALPVAPPVFWLYAGVGGLSQVLATVAVVALFAERNFAVGITFKKTEVIQTALVGFVLLGEKVTAAALAALLVGLAGVLLLSDPPARAGPVHNGLLLGRFLNRAAGLGLLSGVFFAFAGVGYRAASLSLESGDVALRAGLTLAVVTMGQAIGMALWLSLRAPEQLGRTLKSWRRTAMVGVTSMAGSYCWFAAFTLQTAAYVYAVGQIEVIFGFLIGILVFGERSTVREVAGIGLLTLSIVGLILVV